MSEQRPEPVPAFVESPGRGVDLTFGDAWPGFGEAFADSVSSMPPRGRRGKRLSTYWIDRALARLALPAPGPGAELSLAGGNDTALVRIGDMVVARSLYELFDDEALSVEVVAGALRAWRVRVIERRRAFAIPQTYRRVAHRRVVWRRARGRG
ncbi:hypothetical protein ABFU82_09510 [Nocardioides sp. WV_118_6]|uniref:hypothetical protein n=1 Tax=Nocardioides simplex TaxID=2045 RepID=UPI00214FDFC2|nr:hypothetical protein [Pimelobacter simplex]UUW88970.1 hypothetical protein M0M43_25000 [Pimelobacter simplex]UUW98475.1 hypothetical protein M0M48_13650 [Pimelobacter simplex]